MYKSWNNIKLNWRKIKNFHTVCRVEKGNNGLELLPFGFRIFFAEAFGKRRHFNSSYSTLLRPCHFTQMGQKQIHSDNRRRNLVQFYAEFSQKFLHVNEWKHVFKTCQMLCICSEGGHKTNNWRIGVQSLWHKSLLFWKFEWNFWVF